jgi:hypothetical protein
LLPLLSKLGAMKRFTVPSLTVFAVTLCLIVPVVAFADPMTNQNIEESLSRLQEGNLLNAEQERETFQKSIDQLSDKFVQTSILKDATTLQKEATLLPDMDIQQVLTDRLGASAATNGWVNSIMETRIKQFSGVPLGDVDMKLARMVDTARTLDPVSLQQFSIYMRYFCDPEGRNKTMESAKFGLTGVRYVGCGKSWITDEADSARDKISIVPYNVETAKLLERDIINKPLKVDSLFFAPITYPVSGDAAADGGGYSNVTPYAKLYFPAIIQSIEFLLGPPENIVNKGDLESSSGKAGYMLSQAKNARKSIATYVFALLSANRVQSMPSSTAKLLADMLHQNLGDAASNKDAVRRIEMLRKQPGVSVAEYMNIMMYELPTSPGYIERVNNMSPEQLAREKIRLLGMQSALGFENNRWMEILMALEATHVQQ